MEDTKRKLGWKNYSLYIVLVVIVGIVGALFGNSIFLFNRAVETYDISSGSTVLDGDYNVIELPTGGQMVRKATGSFVLSMTNKDGVEEKHDLGNQAIVYSDSDYKFYIHGTAYSISSDTSVKKSEVYEEVKKSEPSFYKLGDRKYCIADKIIKSKEISLSESGYLVVDIDRQGNATLVNNKINIKTINPIIIKGTYFDFDVAREKLIVGDEEIDLTTVIGSSNEYRDSELADANDGSDTAADRTKDLSYYDDYVRRMKNSFNNLYNSSVKAGKRIDDVNRRTSVSIDLTKWTNVTSVSSTPSTVTLDYAVFDPNNNYSQVFAVISESGTDTSTRISLSKESSSFTFRDLKPDKKYSIQYGYTLAKVVDSEQHDVVVDNLIVVTGKPKTTISISKISTNKVDYVLKLDKEYAISQAVIHLFVDGVERASTNYNIASAVDYTYSGSFALGATGRTIEIRATDMVYAGVGLDGTISDIYINE